MTTIVRIFVLGMSLLRTSSALAHMRLAWCSSTAPLLLSTIPRILISAPQS
jgi:hypothetical protein